MVRESEEYCEVQIRSDPVFERIYFEESLFPLNLCDIDATNFNDLKVTVEYTEESNSS